MPRAIRIGAMNNSASSIYGRVSGTRPVTVTPRLLAKRRTAAAAAGIDANPTVKPQK